MVKRHTTLSIDTDVLEKAKERGLNLSDVAERALKEKSGQSIQSEDDDIVCFYCRRKEEKASRDNNFTGMVWLCPDEFWCCSTCLKNKVREVITAISG